jgi:SAM-dependent methyltransferase
LAAGTNDDLNRDVSGTFEIKDDNIDVQDIMRQIRKNIEGRKSQGAYTKEDEALVNTPCIIDYTKQRDAKDIQDLIDNSSLDYDYSITSHRKIFGPIIVKGRQLVNGEVKRYVDPRLMKQSFFNKKLISIIEEQQNNHQKEIRDLTDKVMKLESLMNSQFGGMSWQQFYSMDIKEDDLQGNVGHHREFISLIREYADKSAMGKTPRLIEVGLGTATFSIYLSRLSYYNVGIDNDQFIVRKAIETNKKLGGYAKFMMMDAFDLGLFKDECFDVAFSQGTMEHFNNAEIVELLKKQLGAARYVLFSVPSVNWPRKEFGNERKMTIEEWKVLLNDQGMRILHLDYYQEKTQIACVIERAGRNDGR